MATSKCPTCESSRFEMVEMSPGGSRFKVMAVQCSSCGSVVGVTDFYNTASLLEKIAKKIGIYNLF